MAYRPPVLPHLAAIRPYSPGKPVEELEREMGISDAIKLASNESPVGPSPHAVQAAAAVLAESNRYPDATNHRLRARVAALHSVPPAELIFGNGSNEIIDLIVRACAGPDDHAVIGTPSFVCYGLSLRIAQVPFTEVPLRQSLHWDVDALEAAVTDRTRLLFIDNPNNPTGSYIPEDRLRRLLANLGPNVIPVVDEAYVHFADAPDYATALDMRRDFPNLIVLRTFSKAFGLAALRVGYGVAHAALVEALERIKPPFNVATPAQAAAEAALDDMAHVDRYVQLNRSERARLAEALQRLGLQVAPSQTNFLCVGLRGPAAPVEQSLLRQGVIIRTFGGPMQNFLRVTVGLPEENDRLLLALEKSLG